MARPTRELRRRSLNVANLMAGDWVVLGSSLILFITLIANWWVKDANDNSVWKSQIYFLVMLILILITIALIIYPMMQVEAGFPSLPFANPPIFIMIGLTMTIGTVYEFGRYTGVLRSTVGPGFGIYLALIGCLMYLLGAVVKWGSREMRIRPE